MTSIDDLARQITQAVREYTEDVAEGIAQAVDEAAEEVRQQAAANAPRWKGRYYKGFKVTKDDRGGVTRRVIWNKKHYRLVHLLEFGHATKGRRVSGKPHLRPAYDTGAAKLQDNVRRIIQNGG